MLRIAFGVGRKYKVEGRSMKDDDDEGDFDSVEIPPEQNGILVAELGQSSPASGKD